MKTDYSSVFIDISGLKPKAFLVLGRGFVREEWKSLCFKKGKSITQDSIQSEGQLSQSMVPESKGRLLERSARVELLKQSLKDPHLRSGFPLLLAHRFRPQFYDSLDRAVQKGRQFFAHAEEAKVLEDRLVERLGFEGRREEFFLLNQFWERVLALRDFYDEARILEVASLKLQTKQVTLAVPKLYQLEHFAASPRLQFFWDAVSTQVEVVKILSSELKPPANGRDEKFSLEYRVVHSLEDGAHHLIDEILKGSIDSQAVVIEDRPEVRRSLKRVANERGLPLQDPRDPTLLIQSEEIKSALLELEIVARNYPSALVLPWISTFMDQPELLRKKLIESGASQGLGAYTGMPEVEAGLNALKLCYPARMSLSELVPSVQASVQKLSLPGWVNLALGRIFSAWLLSLRQMGFEHRKRPLRYWLEQIQDKIKTSPPLVTPQKNAHGLKLFRVDQGISMDLDKQNLKIHFFGVSAGFFDPREQTSEWFSARDIEVLANEFRIPGREENGKQARASFLSWCALSRQTPCFWEYRHNEEGSETESLTLVLHSFDEVALSEAVVLPVHSQVLPSLGPKLKTPLHFTRLAFTRTEFPMSFLSSLGNCAFTAYAQHLLALFDERDPDFDLSGDTFGNLVHAAVEHLVSNQLKVSPLQAFEFAWGTTQKLAWMKSERLFRALRHKTLSILESFIASETEYRLRSGTEVIDQEMSVKLRREGLVFSGRVDRIDQHADGIVLIDYKTSGALPSGTQTLELSKGLQLPAYALALKESLNQEVVSAQYVHLAPLKTNRNVGFLFTHWNKGKAADKVAFPLSTARSNSASLVNREPESVWQEMDQKMISLLKLAKLGVFKAEPSDPKDCIRCRYLVICGKKRDRAQVVDEEAP